MNYPQNREALRRMLDRKRAIAEEMNEIGWRIWSLQQEESRLSTQQTPGA